MALFFQLYWKRFFKTLTLYSSYAIIWCDYVCKLTCRVTDPKWLYLVVGHTSNAKLLMHTYQVLCSVLKSNLSCQLNPHKSVVTSKDDSSVGWIEDSQLHALVGYMVILDNNIQPCVYRYATATVI